MMNQSNQDENDLDSYEKIDSLDDSLKLDDKESSSDSDLNIEDDE